MAESSSRRDVSQQHNLFIASQIDHYGRHSSHDGDIGGWRIAQPGLSTACRLVALNRRVPATPKERPSIERCLDQKPALGLTKINSQALMIAAVSGARQDVLVHPE